MWTKKHLFNEIVKNKRNAEMKIRDCLASVCEEFAFETGLQIKMVNVEFIKTQEIAQSEPRYHLGSAKINIGF